MTDLKWLQKGDGPTILNAPEINNIFMPTGF